MWPISKATKKRYQGMGNVIFMLFFKLCPRGVSFKIKVCFYVFKHGGFCQGLQIQFFRGPLLSHF